MKLTLKCIILLLTVAVLQVSCSTSSTQNDKTEQLSAEDVPHNNPNPPNETRHEARIPNNLVCMVNNAFMGIEQIPVIVGDKTYYGCCDMCEEKLKTGGDEHRFGVDPFSGEKVDKASAFIVLTTAGSYQVSYYSSEENYLAHNAANH